jgi:XTP/dITP diphosphohydrolase
MKKLKILIATTNQGKARDLSKLMKVLPHTFVSLSDLGINEDVEETGSTFEENAVIKSNFYAKASGLLTIADDSGLEVDALGGKPGIHSKRFAGEDATDADRLNLLLSLLSEYPLNQRNARYRCCLVLSDPSKVIGISEGICEGIITSTPQGYNGFGYDPIFLIPELEKTMAEISEKVKNKISHRGQAAKKLSDFILKEAILN